MLSASERRGCPGPGGAFCCLHRSRTPVQISCGVRRAGVVPAPWELWLMAGRTGRAGLGRTLLVEFSLQQGT